MIRTIKCLVLFFIVFGPSGLLAQDLFLIEGRVIATEDVEGIHVINETSSKFTITSSDGRFVIPVKLQDTLLFSGIKFQPKRVVVDSGILSDQNIAIELEELVNLLDTVLVGKILTGDLDSDLQNAEIKEEINFYNLGIPGYTGPRKTLEERKLYAATSGNGLIPLVPIINAITGRTKMLKEQLRLARTNTQMDLFKSKYAALLFEEESDIAYINRFFYFVSDDPKFLTLSKSNNELVRLEFLMKKKVEYSKLIESKTDD